MFFNTHDSICLTFIQYKTILLYVLHYPRGLTMKSAPGPQIITDFRLISSFLTNLPVLNSKLNTTQIPAQYLQQADKYIRLYTSLFKYMLIEVDENSKFGLASNFKKIVDGKVDSQVISNILKWKGVTKESEISEIKEMIKN